MKRPSLFDLTDGSSRIPHSVEAEQGLLGCLLLEPADNIGHCIEQLKGGPEAFHDLRHRTIYETLLELHQAGKPIEMISVHQVLKDRGVLEGVGGLAYVASLPDSTPSGSNIDYYLGIVAEKFTLRQIINTATEVVSRAHEHTGDVDGLVAEVEQDFTKIADSRISEDAKVAPKEAVLTFIADMEDRVKRQGTPSGIVTGYNDLDELTDGLQYGEQFVIGARPSIGKTAFGLNLMVRVCLNHKIPTLFISLEQSAKALMRRMASIYCHINGKHLKRGNLTENEMAMLHKFNLEYKSSPATIYDFVKTGATAPIISSIIKRAVRRDKVKMVIIDYLQKIIPTGKHEKRTYEVAAISGMLRATAVETGVVMVTLAQLNRENEKEKGRLPRISDLADSGQIERDADMVGLLHRNRFEAMGPAQLLIAKQRDGETGQVNLHFNGKYCEFNNGTKEEPL